MKMLRFHRYDELEMFVNGNNFEFIDIKYIVEQDQSSLIPSTHNVYWILIYK